MIKKIALVLFLFTPLTLNAGGEPHAGQDKSAACGACHGALGLSINPDWPNLAGQHAAYLIKQLHDFKQGDLRNAALMTPMVANLTNQDIDDLAAFYAKQPVPQGETPKKYRARGEQLYRVGDFNKHITACIACHGPQGAGNAQAGFPALSGQHAAYTIQQLQAFKDNTRHNDLNSIMRNITARMSEEDMAAIAHYLTGLH